MGGRGASSTTGKGRGVGVANIGSFLTSFDLIDQKKTLDDVVTSTIDEFINKQNYYLVAQSKRGVQGELDHLRTSKYFQKQVAETLSRKHFFKYSDYFDLTDNQLTAMMNQFFDASRWQKALNNRNA